MTSELCGSNKPAAKLEMKTAKHLPYLYKEYITWKNESGQMSRVIKPAQYTIGEWLCWYLNGVFYREYGPAAICLTKVVIKHG